MGYIQPQELGPIRNEFIKYIVKSQNHLQKKRKEKESDKTKASSKLMQPPRADIIKILLTGYSSQLHDCLNHFMSVFPQRRKSMQLSQL